MDSVMSLQFFLLHLLSQRLHSKARRNDPWRPFYPISHLSIVAIFLHDNYEVFFIWFTFNRLLNGIWLSILSVWWHISGLKSKQFVRQRGGAVIGAVASQQETSWFKSAGQLGCFCVEFACSPEDVHVRLTGNSKLATVSLLCCRHQWLSESL